MSNQDLHPAFKRARRSLLLDHPFFGNLVMYLEPVEDPSCKLVWVNGKQIGFNPEAFAALPAKEVAGVLAHEVLHAALEHCVRRGDRDADTWNDAADYVINPIVADSGLSLPQGALSSSEHAGRTAEEVYRLLQEQKQKDQENQQGSGSGVGQNSQGNQGDADGTQEGAQDAVRGQAGASTSEQAGEAGSSPTSNGQGQSTALGQCTGEVRDMPGDDGQSEASPAERTANAQEWQVSMQQAMNNALSQGSMPAGLMRTVQEALTPKVSWQDELRRFCTAVARDDLSWMRPNRRYLQRKIYMPSMKSEGMGPMVVVVDTSGSIGSYILGLFEKEINAIAEDMHPEAIHVVYCDSAVARTEEYSVEDLPIKLRPAGGGGTDFRPPFKWIEQQGLEPACVVYLTDLFGSFPEHEPEWSVLWAATNERKAPFGDTVQIR